MLSSVISDQTRGLRYTVVNHNILNSLQAARTIRAEERREERGVHIRLMMRNCCSTLCWQRRRGEGDLLADRAAMGEIGEMWSLRSGLGSFMAL